MKFFVDNNLSTHLAAGMAAFQEDVTHLREHYPENTGDEVWLQDIGSKGWILVTRDEAIRRKPAELDALRTHRVGAFFLGGKNRSRCDLIQQLIRNWPQMKSLASKTKRPFAFRVPPAGTKFDPIPL